MSVTAEAARRFLVARHALAPARSLEGGRTPPEVFRRLGSIQFDPAGGRRSHPRPRPARTRGRLRPRLARPALRAARDLRGVQQGTLLRPDARLPVVPRDGEPERPAPPCRERRGGRPRARADPRRRAVVLNRLRARAGGDDRLVRRADEHRSCGLEAYTVTGVLGLARRDGNRRYYDLIERLLPADVLAAASRSESSSVTSSRYRAHGLLGVGEAAISSAASAPPSRTQSGPNRPAERHFVRSSSTTASWFVEIEGVRGKRFVIKEEVGLLESPRSRRPRSHSCPRSIQWSGIGGLLGSLFEFDYVWSSSSRRQNGVGAGTCCRCSSATASSAASSRASTAPPQRCRCSTSGGRAASRRAPRASSTRRDALRAYLHFAGATRSNGHRTSRRRDDCFSCDPRAATAPTFNRCSTPGPISFWDCGKPPRA